MGFRYQLKLYVLSTASNVRTHIRGRLEANESLKVLLEKEARKLLWLFDDQDERLLMYAGKHTTRMALEEATSRLIYDVAPILAIARARGVFVRCDLYFSDTTITNAFKSGAINKWKQTGFKRRSGGQPLEHGDYWAMLHKLVNDLRVVICDNPFDDPTMQRYHDELKAEYRNIVKQLKRKLKGT